MEITFKKKLESIVCKNCDGAKIDKKLFPNTPAEPFWTSQRNWWSPKFYWSINFLLVTHMGDLFLKKNSLLGL